MAGSTTNLSLVKPTYAESQDVTVLNGNFDLIDAEAGKVRENFAGAYSSSQAYAVGDYCTYQGNLYRCTTAIGSSGEAWTSGHWTQVAVGDELSSLSEQIATVSGTTTPTYPDANVTSEGSTPCFYIKSGSSITIKLSIKITNAQTGYVNRKIVNLNLPDAIKPTYVIDSIIANGEGDGFTFISLATDGKLTIFPQKTGTTYASGIFTYVV